MLLNGKNVPLRAPCTVEGLLKMLGFRAELVAVEVNGQLVPRAAFADEVVRDGDAVEIVTFVGGG